MSYPFHDGLSGAEAAARADQDNRDPGGFAQRAALLIEPIQGEGGFIVPATDSCQPCQMTTANGRGSHRRRDQSGFCRTGDWFAVDHEGVIPDLVTTAKGLAGGMPLAR